MSKRPSRTEIHEQCSVQMRSLEQVKRTPPQPANLLKGDLRRRRVRSRYTARDSCHG